MGSMKSTAMALTSSEMENYGWHFKAKGQGHLVYEHENAPGIQFKINPSKVIEKEKERTNEQR